MAKNDLVVVGTQADVTLINVTVEQLTDDETWFLVSLPNFTEIDTPYIWLPNDDASVEVASVVPTDWPMVEDDIWETPMGEKAWIVSDGASGLLFALVSDIQDKKSPMTPEDALALYGSGLTLVYRV